MIKNDNLFLGSYLTDQSNDVFQVVAIGDKDIRVFNKTQDQFINLWIPTKKFKQITITEEWLEELGFFKSDKNKYVNVLTSDVVLNVEFGSETKICKLYLCDSLVKYIFGVDELQSIIKSLNL